MRFKSKAVEKELKDKDFASLLMVGSRGYVALQRIAESVIKAKSRADFMKLKTIACASQGKKWNLHVILALNFAKSLESKKTNESASSSKTNKHDGKEFDKPIKMSHKNNTPKKSQKKRGKSAKEKKSQKK